MLENLREKYRQVAPPGEYFDLRGGGKSKVYYDFRAMTDEEIGDPKFGGTLANKLGREYLRIFGEFTAKDPGFPVPLLDVVGIVTFGWRIVKIVFRNPFWFNPHTNETSVPDPRKYILVDDVFTVGSTCKKAFEFFGYKPEAIIVLVNRSGMDAFEGVPITELLPETVHESVWESILRFPKRESVLFHLNSFIEQGYDLYPDSPTVHQMFYELLEKNQVDVEFDDTINPYSEDLDWILNHLVDLGLVDTGPPLSITRSGKMVLEKLEVQKTRDI